MAILEGNIAAAGGLRNITVKDVQRVLSRADDDGLPMMTEEHAKSVWIALQKGFSQTPASILGLQKIEEFARFLPFQIAAKVPGGSKMTQNRATLAMMSLPTNLIRVRDQLRFTLSPFFSIGNVAEANLKMGLDGVKGTFTPIKNLRNEGVYDQAHLLLDKIQGAQGQYKYLDDIDHFLDQSDVFGLFNIRHYEAYYAWQKKQDGWSDEQIGEGLIRVFRYGARGQEGRNAVERTVNAIWFPFSFQKTIVRNVGGYLLDRPAQAMILSNAMDAYRDFNNHHLNGDNPLAASWYKEHLPLLNEALRLNAFARASARRVRWYQPSLAERVPAAVVGVGQEVSADLRRFVPGRE